VSINVLVVEDDRITAVDLRDTLEDHGFVVCGVVHSGDVVVGAVRELKPDLVLMDVNIEGSKDGVQAAHIVIGELGVPVVFLTAQADARTIRRMHEVGAAGVLTKPFSETELPRVLRAALDQAREVQQIAERGDRLWVTLQAIADAVITVDADGRVDHLNPAAERLSGWPIDQARGRHIEAVLDLRTGRDGPSLESPARKALADKTVQTLAPNAWLHPRQGEPRRVGDTVAPIHDDDGEVTGAVLVLQDLSEREQLQNLLTRADRLASMGTMAAGIAHEINNPLTYIVNNVLFALSELEQQQVGSEVLDALRDVEFGARSIERIVSDLKLLSSPDQRSQEAVDVAPVLRRSQRMSAKAVRARGRFEASLKPTQPVLANPIALGQVVTNLVLNAAQALPEEYSADHVVRLTCRDQGDSVVIEVQDNGEGIPAAIRERIFDPFFTTKAVGKDTGLGLAITHQIVADLGGHIEIDSQVGRGTTVRVLLPAHSVVPDDDEDHDSLPRDSWPERRVLIVDDDDKVLRALRLTLGRVHDVKTLSSVDEAMAHLGKGFGYDAILCDLMMSPRNGTELLDGLTVVAPDLVQRMAFITGGVFTGSLHERVLRSGRPVAYKPFQSDQLYRLVESLAQT